MFGLLKKQKKQNTSKLELKISGMHCTSCGLNIDGELEDLEGVISSQTSYAGSKVKVEFDPEKIDRKKIVETISSLDYTVQA